MRRAGFVGLFPTHKISEGVTAVTERLPPHVTLTAHLCFHARRKRVDHGNTHAVQTTGHSVSTASELSARVQDGHYHLDGWATFRGMHVHRNAAAIILNRDSAVLADRNFNMVTVSGQRLINCVINDFVHQVVKTSLAR